MKWCGLCVSVEEQKGMDTGVPAIRVCFPTDHSRRVWARRLVVLNNMAPASALSFSLVPDQKNCVGCQENLMRVHHALLSAKDPVEWTPQTLKNTPSLFRLEDCTKDTYKLEHKNTFFVTDAKDLFHIIRWKAQQKNTRPSALLATMSIYEYKVLRDDLELVILTPSYGYLDAEKWVQSIDGTYNKSFTSADTGDNFVLATYIDKKEKGLDGFVDEHALYGYYGRNQVNPLEILLTGTALARGALSIGRRLEPVLDMDGLFPG